MRFPTLRLQLLHKRASEKKLSAIGLVWIELNAICDQMPRWDRRNLETFFVKGRSIQGRRTLAHSAISEEKSEAGFLNTKAKCQHFKYVSRQKRSAGKPGIGSSIKLKTKCKKK